MMTTYRVKAYRRALSGSFLSTTRIAGLIAGSLAMATLPATAAERVVGGSYSVYLNGFKLGEGSVSAQINGKRYAISGNSRLSGLAGAIVKFSTAGRANGQFHGAGHRPSGFAATSLSGKRKNTVQMAMRGGSVATVKRVPAVNTHGKVPVTKAHQRGIVDPMSAMFLPVSGKNALDPRNCNRTIPIYNGRERFNIKLSYKNTRNLDASFKGGNVTTAIICQARFEPISGHRAGRKEIEYFRNERGIEVWLVAAGQTGVLIPYRVAIPTPVGHGVVQLKHMSARGDARTAMR